MRFHLSLLLFALSAFALGACSKSIPAEKLQALEAATDAYCKCTLAYAAAPKAERKSCDAASTAFDEAWKAAGATGAEQPGKAIWDMQLKCYEAQTKADEAG